MIFFYIYIWIKANRVRNMAIGKAEKAAYNDEIKDIKKEVEATTKIINEVMAKKKKNSRWSPTIIWRLPRIIFII